MSKFHRKVEKIEPLIRVRQLQLDQEMALLQQLQKKRQTAKEELYYFQMMYIEGVDKLNKERQSPERKMLEALERSIDLAKSRWYQKLQVLRTIEDEEHKQDIAVQTAHKNLRMLEKLDDRYTDQLKKHLGKTEQKELDEFAIQNSRRKMSE